MIERLKQYFLLMRLHKPIGILLLLWPTLWALWLANGGSPAQRLLFIFIMGTILMRSAGCIVNDFADRHWDGQVRRTAQRPLVTGKVRVREALFLFVLLCLMALMLILDLNYLTWGCAVLGLIFTVFYPYMKRFTHLPQLGLGVVFAWSIPMAFAAEQNQIPGQAIFLFATAMLWPVIYDTLYAMTDREDDLKVGIKSTAILFGGADRLIIGVLQMVFLLALSIVGFLFHLQLIYYVSLALCAFLFLYQQFLIRNRNPSACFKAFLNNNWVGALIFMGIAFSL